MARARMPNPFENLRTRSSSGVQNTGGLAPNTAPLAQRPVSGPGVRLGRPGPAAGGGFLSGGGAGGLGGAVGDINTSTGPIVTAGAQAANQRFQQRRGQSQRQVASLSGQQYGREGGGGLEGQIRGALGGMFSGQTSKGFVDRAKQALGSGIEGQRAQASRRIDDDAIRRGLFRSGIPAEQQGALQTSSQGAFSQGLADILSQAEQQDIQGRQFATGAGTNLLGMNRSYDQYLQQQIDAARGRGRGGPGTSTIIDPDTGQSYEIDQSVLRYF